MMGLEVNGDVEMNRLSSVSLISHVRWNGALIEGMAVMKSWFHP